jgi:hypothetical protein
MKHGKNAGKLSRQRLPFSVFLPWVISLCQPGAPRVCKAIMAKGKLREMVCFAPASNTPPQGDTPQLLFITTMPISSWD